MIKGENGCPHSCNPSGADPTCSTYCSAKLRLMDTIIISSSFYLPIIQTRLLLGNHSNTQTLVITYRVIFFFLCSDTNSSSLTSCEIICTLNLIKFSFDQTQITNLTTFNPFRNLDLQQGIQQSYRIQAKNRDMRALKANNPRQEVEWLIFHREKPISWKWMYEIELGLDGSLERFKARLVVRRNTPKRWY